jgi:predicted nucleic acid-binding protein
MRFWSLAADENDLFLCSYSLEELDRVVARKFPAKKQNLAVFLQKLQYTLVRTRDVNNTSGVNVIRDPKDYPILTSAISADVDILISGDKDFESVNTERLEILTISEFMKKYDSDK